MAGIVGFFIGIAIGLFGLAMLLFLKSGKHFGLIENRDSVSETETTAYMKQYINFLNYNGSGKGQKSIEN